MSYSPYTFEVDKEKTQDYWLEVREINGPWKVSLTWDGCLNINSSDGEFIHICDLDRHIEKCENLKKMAKAHFGAQWPDL